MSKHTYHAPQGGLPGPEESHYEKAIFTTAYAVIPREVMANIVTSNLPNWAGTRAWILARPLTGFAETFAQYLVEVAPGGGSDAPEPDPEAEGVIFVLSGAPSITINGSSETLRPGSYVFLAPGDGWSLTNPGEQSASFSWVRKRYVPAPGISPPTSFVTHDDDATPNPMPGHGTSWATSRFVKTDDLSHDIHVNIVTFEPGGKIPFAETHVMEHGIYILQGQASYLLNGDWVEVEAGDFLWLRAFCPQACIASGNEPFRYLLYKDVNRHPDLVLP